MTKRKCVICGQRPWATDDGYCHICADKLAAERRRKNNSKPTPERYLVYQGHVVGLFKNGTDGLIPRLVSKAIKKLPKGKTVNLDKWCTDYTREQVKLMKKAVKEAVRVGVYA